MPWIENKYFYQSACSEPTANTPAVVGADIYNRAQQGWSVWARNAGITY